MQTSSSSFFSVVMATFNCEKCIEGALNSVLSKDYPSLELVISDGGSTDRTLELILKFNDPRIKIACSEADNGIYDAWNKALDKTNGEWIFFLGADDRLTSEISLLDLEAKLKELHRSINLVQIPIVIFDSIAGNSFIWPTCSSSPLAYAPKSVAEGNFAHPGIMHRREVFEKYGNFDAKFRIAGDLEFILRVLIESDNHLYQMSSPPVTQFSIGGISNAPRTRLRTAIESLKAIQNVRMRVPLSNKIALLTGFLVTSWAHLFGDELTRRHIRFFKAGVSCFIK